MSEPSQQVRTIIVGGEKVDLPLDVYDKIQEMINQERGGDALVLLRQVVKAQTRHCIAALRETTNFDLSKIVSVDQIQQGIDASKPAPSPDQSEAPKPAGGVGARVDGFMASVSDVGKGRNAVVAAFALVVMVASITAIYRHLNPNDISRARIRDAWYLDLQTGKLFAAKTSAAAPIDAPSGPGNGVRAYVYACGSCDDQTKRKVGFLQRIGDGHTSEVSRGDDIQWYPVNSVQGASIMEESMSACGPGIEAEHCQPRPSGAPPTGTP